MSTLRNGIGPLLTIVLLALANTICIPAAAAATAEQTFPVLQIGTQTFTNATVTTRASNYVFIVHAGGMANIKVANLPDDAREILGYPTAAQRAQAAASNSVSGWAKSKISRLQPEHLKELEPAWISRLPTRLPALNAIPLRVLIALGVGVLLGYLFFCYCCKRICDKVGYEPGLLVWLPLLQSIALFRAAGMSPAWFFALLVPVLNVFAQILWLVKIVQARGKSPWLVLPLLLPITNILAFLYLAFSTGAPKEEKRGPQIMTLEAV